jgi:hypothetical protein
VASAARNNTPVMIESTFVIFGFKMTEFWVNSFKINPETSFKTSSRVYQ